VRQYRKSRNAHYFEEALSRPTVTDFKTLRRILVLRAARPDKKWGNLRKEWDTLGKALPRMVPTKSGSQPTSQAVNQLLKEAFRARAIDMTSDRYFKGPSKSCIPSHSQRYATYGQPARGILGKPTSPYYKKTLQQVQKKHKARLATYNRWSTKPGSQPTLAPHSGKKLTTGQVQRTLALGLFTALQVATDLHAQAPRLVKLPSSLGPGVALDKKMDTAEVAALTRLLNGNSQFRRVAGSFDVATGGHLVCEVRQWTMQGFTRQQATAWMQSLSAEPVPQHRKLEWQAMVEELRRIS